MSLLATAAVGGGTAAAAPGGGAVVVPTTCLITVPGFPDVTGAGTVVITPSGAQRVTCHAQLPAGTAPPKTVRINAGPCWIIVNSQGQVTSHC